MLLAGDSWPGDEAAASDAGLFLVPVFASFIFDLSCSYRLYVLFLAPAMTGNKRSVFKPSSCCLVISAEEPGHLEGAVPGGAAGLSPACSLCRKHGRTEMPRFTVLHLVTHPALGKRLGLRGPALELGFE